METAAPKATIRALKDYAGQTVQVRGWLYNLRKGGKILFLQLRDGTGIVQAVAEKKTLGEACFQELRALPQESSLMLTGLVHADERAPGGVELHVSAAEIVAVAEDYPIRKFSEDEEGPGVEFLMNNRHLWLRAKRQSAIMRIRHTIIQAMRNFLDEEGFILADAPIFTPNACEGTTTLFSTQYFDDTVYLSQSGQLYNEATAMALGKTYCFGPTFRAERSKTRRHLMEFWMIEPEMAYANLNDVMNVAEAMVFATVQEVLRRNRRDLEDLERDVTALEKLTLPFPRMHYREAVAMLHQNGAEFQEGDDFGAPDEDLISRQFDSPVLIHHYPAAVKAFYMKNDPADPAYALCVDMIAPEGYGEIVGGGQREDSLETLRAKLRQHELPEEVFDWYLDLRRYGSVPHGGFGLGVERFVAWLCGIRHIREAIPFPRMLYRVRP
jgi:asparaginyl-tRNA synthetase